MLNKAGLAQLSRDYVSVLRSSIAEFGSEDSKDKEQLQVVIECLEGSLNLASYESKNVDKLQELYADSQPGQQPDHEKANELKLEGTQFLKEKKYEEAIKKYSEAMQYHADNAALFYNRGLVRFNLKQFEKAKSDLRHAIQLLPSYSRAHFKLSQVLLAEKDFDGALEIAKRALELNNTDSDIDITKKKEQEEQFKKNIEHIEQLKNLAANINNSGSGTGNNPNMMADFAKIAQNLGLGDAAGLGNLKDLASNLANGKKGEDGSSSGDASGFNLGNVGDIAKNFLSDPKNLEAAKNLMASDEFKKIYQDLMKNQP